MSVHIQTVIRTAAQELHLSQEDLLRQGTRSLLERQLLEVKAEIFRISGRYGVSGAQAMEARYQDGSLVCNQTRTCDLLPTPAGPDFLSAVWEQLPVAWQERTERYDHRYI